MKIKMLIFMALTLFFASVFPAYTSALSLNLNSFATGLTAPVDIANTGVTGDDRLFAVERGGIIKVVQSNGTVLGTPFLDIDSRVQSGSEEGLLGLAFHPGYSWNRQFYVYYTNNSGDIVISRFLRSSGDANVADPNSEQIVISVGHPSNANHNGGDLNFGPNDGLLYAAVGDGGGGGDSANNAQNKDKLLGKIVRLNVNADDFPTDSLKNYSVVSSNPFVGKPGSDDIWSMGLRNPWRFSFDRSLKHMYIGDVGQNNREEVNFEHSASIGGKNFGWRCYEGTANFNTSGCGGYGSYDAPVADYDHSSGACSVTGGFVYRGNQYPLLEGHYIYMDYCNARAYTLSLKPGGGWNAVLQTTFAGRNISSFGEDINGEIYASDISNGTIYHVQEGTTVNSFPVYRLANPYLKERLFSISALERDHTALSYNYVYESTGFMAAKSTDTGAYPVYRLAHHASGERLLTINSAERTAAISQYGYTDEGIAFYGIPSSTGGAVPVYRLSNPLTRERLFTISTVERDQAVTQHGFVSEGTAWHAP